MSTAGCLFNNTILKLMYVFDNHRKPLSFFQIINQTISYLDQNYRACNLNAHNNHVQK